MNPRCSRCHSRLTIDVVSYRGICEYCESEMFSQWRAQEPKPVRTRTWACLVVCCVIIAGCITALTRMGEW